MTPVAGIICTSSVIARIDLSLIFPSDDGEREILSILVKNSSDIYLYTRVSKWRRESSYVSNDRVYNRRGGEVIHRYMCLIIDYPNFDTDRVT